MGFLKNLFGGGGNPATREAKQKMALDQADPRKAFVWGVLAVSYEVDPAYLPEHAREAVNKWYGIQSASKLLAMTAQGLSANQHPAYNQYRLCFLARAAYGAGLLDEAGSWALAFQHAAPLQRAYADWASYGQGYLAGHLAYREKEGDSPAQLAQYRANIEKRLLARQRDCWSSIAWNTPF
jgi:hypothetical protein